MLQEFLKVGFIQTVFNSDLAWNSPLSVNINPIVGEYVWQQIKNGFSDISDKSEGPEIIILPEVTVPHNYRKELMKLCRASKAAVIAGLDFNEVLPDLIENRAVVLVPSNWPKRERSYRVSEYTIGKTYFSEEEIKHFTNLRKQKCPDNATYVFDAGKYGRIGVAICSDFFDLERFTIYKGYIHHMLVISHNKDTESYYFLAEAIARLVYCNVIICNTGFYGDSIAFSPFDKHYSRIIYRHKGQNLFSTQVIKLPVRSLDEAQKKNDAAELFKSPPPGYIYKSQAKVREIRF